GWVPSSRLVEKKPSVTTRTLQTTKSAVVRVAVASTSKAVKTLPKGTKVTVLDSTSRWRAVKVGATRGWVLATSLAAVPAAKTMQTTTSLNVRSSASTKAKIVTTLKKGTKVSVTASKGDWRKVSVSGKVGWAHSDYLKAVPAKVVKTTTTSLNLR